MKRFLVLLAVLLPFALGLFIMSCDQTDWEHHPLSEKDGNLYAKDMNSGMTCDKNNVVIQDCYDACSCCHLGQVDGTASCVVFCDNLLLEAQDPSINESRADYTGYQECILGCVSLCGQNESGDVCWNECKYYLYK